MQGKHNMNSKTLICIAGLGGAIGSTIAVGLSVTNSTNSIKKGMVTESPIIKSLGLEFPSLETIIIDGWDIERENLYNIAKKQEICPDHFISNSKDKLKNIIPRMGITENVSSIKDWIINETNYIKEVCEKNNIGEIIIINLCPTEPFSLQHDSDEIDWEKLDSINFNLKGITLSRLYFRLAIEIGAHFINFTPNLAETRALKKLAEERGIAYCGRDGKTGQTFLKTVIAPALRDRNLHVEGWFSTNILGNADGKALSQNDTRATKINSKIACLSSILGYNPGNEDSSNYCHQVHIHYYPPRGDAKESWDNIDFTGFMDSKMQMKINWLGKDSILAAPLIIDLTRLICLAVKNNKRGLISEVAYFFKNPLCREGQRIEHSTSDQFNVLVNYLQKFAK